LILETRIMKKQKTKSPDEKAYLAAIDEALAEADKGIFVSGEAVFEWMKSWGTDNVKPFPEPDIFPRKRRSPDLASPMKCPP
jgi:hypothetical protein